MEMIPRDKDSLILKAAICGFLAGDGSVQKRKEKESYHYQIDFFPDDELMMNTYINFIKKIYNKIPTVRKRDRFYSVRLTSKVIVNDLSSLANFGIKKWTLPRQLFSIDDAVNKWLRAFFSAEGYVSGKLIRVQTINQGMMRLISKILLSLGIDNKYYGYNNKNKYESPVGIIIISNKISMMRYHNLIGFWHSKKSETLSKALGL